MKVHLAADHAGFEFKRSVAAWLEGEGFTVVDHGAFVYDDQDDFPDFIVKAAHAVAKNPTTDRAIIFGGSGQGEAMLANRFPNVRATVLYTDNPQIVALSREHNDANVLSIGARFITLDVSKKHIWDWLHTPTSRLPKYQRRVTKVEQLTKNLHT